MKRKSASYESLAMAKRQHVLHQPALVPTSDDALTPFAHAKSLSATGLPEFYDGFPSTAHALVGASTEGRALAAASPQAQATYSASPLCAPRFGGAEARSTTAHPIVARPSFGFDARWQPEPHSRGARAAAVGQPLGGVSITSVKHNWSLPSPRERHNAALAQPHHTSGILFTASAAASPPSVPTAARRAWGPFF